MIVQGFLVPDVKTSFERHYVTGTYVFVLSWNTCMSPHCGSNTAAIRKQYGSNTTYIITRSFKNCYLINRNFPN